ncbi:hypothetical protein [Halorubrum pallidum]|uniref:Uncharacterized protein n=1 Tax=Halorubrum pallidum TaxID=1526114 RepID=A0ABD5T783_9EURY
MPTSRGHHAVVGLGVAAFLASALHHGTELDSLSNLTGPPVATAGSDTRTD